MWNPVLTACQRNGCVKYCSGSRNCWENRTVICNGLWENMWLRANLQLKGVPGKIFLLYYESACIDFQIKRFLLVETDKQVMIKVVF
jgi:hypothetical protein